MLEVSEVGNKVSKADFKAAIPDLRVGLINAQYELRDADFPVVIFVAGDDRIAGNEVVNRLNEWMDARYINTHVFADYSEEEAGRPPLWRLWRAMPPNGRTSLLAGGFMRMVDMRLAGDVSPEQFNTWAGHVGAMQSAWVAEGALVLKFFLHTPLNKQRKKLKKAEKAADQGWRVDQRDWSALDNMGPAVPLVEQLLRATSSPGAPWTIVESTNANYRDLTVAQTILAAITARLKEQRSPSPAIADSVFTDLNAKLNVLSGVDLSQKLDKPTYRQELAKYQAKLHRLSLEARERGVSTVLAFEGWDAAGKGGVIRRLTGSLEAGDYRVIPVAAPTPEELRYHYLWRFWRDLPPAGHVVIFDRTWYGRVLVERVEGFAKPDQWQRAYDEINDFEDQLIERGYFVGKFWLHISPEEQLARFQAREQTPYKQHKITDEDYRNREKWDEYVQAVEQIVLRTSQERAQWQVIPANDKYFARIAVLKAVTQGLTRALREN